MYINGAKSLKIAFKGVKMKILNLKLLNFRNYEKLELSFNPSKNIIIGQNGMGDRKSVV